MSIFLCIKHFYKTKRAPFSAPSRILQPRLEVVVVIFVLVVVLVVVILVVIVVVFVLVVVCAVVEFVILVVVCAVAEFVILIVILIVIIFRHIEIPPEFCFFSQVGFLAFLMITKIVSLSTMKNIQKIYRTIVPFFT